MKKIHECLIQGKPYKINKTIVKLPTLKVIYDLGMEKYFEYLESIIMDYDRIRGHEELNKDTYYTDFDLFRILIISDNKFREMVFEAIEFFTEDRFLLTEEEIVSARKKTTDGILYPLSKDIEGEFVVYDTMSEEMWKELRSVLCIAHWTVTPEEKGPLVGKAAEIVDKLRRNKEEVARLKAKKNKTNDSTEVYELIASACAYSPSYNLFNVWELTYYQFFDHFKRLHLKEEYEFSLEQILAGVDPKKLEIRHWSSSIITQK